MLKQNKIHQHPVIYPVLVYPVLRSLEAGGKAKQSPQDILDRLSAVEYASLSGKQKLKHVATKSKAEASLFKAENRELNKDLSASRADFRTKIPKIDLLLQVLFTILPPSSVSLGILVPQHQRPEHGAMARG